MAVAGARGAGVPVSPGVADGEPVLVPDLDDLELRVERLRSQ